MQFSFQKDISNLAALKAALIAAGYSNPGIVSSGDTITLTVADDAQDPTSFMNSYVDHGCLSVVSDRAIGPMGFPACPADGLSVHTLTIKNVDSNGAVIPSSITVLPIPTQLVPISPLRPTLVNGVGTCSVGPVANLCNIDLNIIDQVSAVIGTRITIQFI